MIKKILNYFGYKKEGKFEREETTGTGLMYQSINNILNDVIERLEILEFKSMTKKEKEKAKSKKTNNHIRFINYANTQNVSLKLVNDFGDYGEFKTKINNKTIILRVKTHPYNDNRFYFQLEKFKEQLKNGQQ